jgi:general stress protein 26
MKAETQANANLAHVARSSDDMSIAMLSRDEADGALAIRPMAALEMDASGVLWFFTDTSNATSAPSA